MALEFEQLCEGRAAVARDEGDEAHGYRRARASPEAAQEEVVAGGALYKYE